MIDLSCENYNLFRCNWLSGACSLQHNVNNLTDYIIAIYVKKLINPVKSSVISGTITQQK